MAFLYETVNYVDEGSVSFRSEWEKTLLEQCKRECGLSIRRIVQMLRLVDGDANANFDRTLEEAREDALQSQSLLDDDAMSTMELIGVIGTTLRWLRWLSVNATGDELKATVAQQLADREEALVGLMSKALRKRRMNVFEALAKLKSNGGM